MIIGFTGKKQSGKSTASEYLMQRFPNAVRLNFKDALVDDIEKKFPDLIKAIIDIMDKTAYDGMNPWTFERLVKDKPPLFRALMQNYGTDVIRAMDPDHWIFEYEAEAAFHQHIITDDVRFLNEANAIRRMGGIIIRIVRTDMANDSCHSSETQMDQIIPDYTIEVGTGEHDKLYAELAAILVIKTDIGATLSYPQQKTSGTAD